MNILLVNNHTRHLKALNKALAGHNIETQMYRPGIKFHVQDKDLVVLSGGGGEGLEIYDEFRPGRLWYEDQLRFVLTYQKPIIGICMGFEVIARAYGSKVTKLDKIIKGSSAISTNSNGYKLTGKKRLIQYESHEWAVPEINSFCLDVLAESKTGVEMIKHKTRPMIATQFHPEKGGTIQLPSLLQSVC